MNTVWNTYTFWAFLLGIDYQEDLRHYSFFYCSFGQLMMILLLVLEWKSEIWINSWFGCSGNTYDQLCEIEEMQKEWKNVFNDQESLASFIEEIKEELKKSTHDVFEREERKED